MITSVLNFFNIQTRKQLWSTITSQTKAIDVHTKAVRESSEIITKKKAEIEKLRSEKTILATELLKAKSIIEQLRVEEKN